MSRTLSQAAVASAWEHRTTKDWLVLLKLTETTDGVAFTRRYVNNYENITSQTHEFTAWPFEVALMSDQEGRPPEVTLRIDNVDQDLIEQIRKQAVPVAVKLEVILADTPNDIEAGPYEFRMKQIRYDDLYIEAALSVEPMYDEGFPGHTMSPSLFPGIFGPVTAAGGRADESRGRGAPAYIYAHAPKKEEG